MLGAYSNAPQKGVGLHGFGAFNEMGPKGCGNGIGFLPSIAVTLSSHEWTRGSPALPSRHALFVPADALHLDCFRIDAALVASERVGGAVKEVGRRRSLSRLRAAANQEEVVRLGWFSSSAPAPAACCGV